MRAASPSRAEPEAASSAVTRPPSSSSDQVPDSAFGLLMALPALLVTLALLAFPLAYSLWASLHEVTLGDAGWQFVGTANYRAIFDDRLFAPALRRTLTFATVVTGGTSCIGLSFALALNRQFPGRNALRALLILPWSLSSVMLALTFGWMFNSTYGPVNGLLYRLGMIDEYQPWFANGRVVLAIMALALIWHLVSFATLLYLGALQTVPEELLRAARIDGAGAWRRLLLVTLPWIRATSLIVIVLSALNGFLLFAPIYVLTGGGPGTDTTLLAWWGYERGFRELELGQSAAIFYVMTVMVSLVAFATVRLVGREQQP